MAATDITYRRGSGEGQGADALQKGDAQTLNASLPTQTVIASEQPPPMTFPTGNPAQGGRAFQPGTDQSSSILFGDAEGAGGGAKFPPGRLPESVVRWLPTMKAAASEPTAPDSLKVIYAAAVNALEEELRR